ncbi:MAG: hypothetical protein SPI56_09155, partial [Alloprevotella sp.]|nr:hypothetical protein [Alloprevotella sp.]
QTGGFSHSPKLPCNVQGLGLIACAKLVFFSKTPNICRDFSFWVGGFYFYFISRGATAQFVMQTFREWFINSNIDTIR